MHDVRAVTGRITPSGLAPFVRRGLPGQECVNDIKNYTLYIARSIEAVLNDPSRIHNPVSSPAGAEEHLIPMGGVWDSLQQHA